MGLVTALSTGKKSPENIDLSISSIAHINLQLTGRDQILSQYGKKQTRQQQQRQFLRISHPEGLFTLKEGITHNSCNYDGAPQGCPSYYTYYCNSIVQQRHTGFFWSKAEDFLLASGVFVRLVEHFNIPTGFMARVMGILKPEANHKRNTFHSKAVQRKCWRYN